MAWPASVITWLAGAKITAAQLNSQIRDALNALGGSWTAYSPAWAGATTNPVIGNGTISGRYRQIGKTVDFQIIITMGSTTTYGTGAYTLTFPVTAVNLDVSGITGYWIDVSAGPVPYAIHAIGNQTDRFRMLSSKDTTFASFNFPFALATSDRIVIGGTYEAA